MRLRRVRRDSEVALRTLASAAAGAASGTVSTITSSSAFTTTRRFTPGAVVLTMRCTPRLRRGPTR